MKIGKLNPPTADDADDIILRFLFVISFIDFNISFKGMDKKVWFSWGSMKGIFRHYIVISCVCNYV
ncbi:MAG: hypothetical protein A2W27_08780 [Deltaproteobacteria bacterium RBG_16_44_11]|nr:MAG: hypothetical protein A2W27_08780 [Deltaproteobacteria bacterium RBG_16_44_11]